jgi:predicted NUDIX family phosphoesterase
MVLRGRRFETVEDIKENSDVRLRAIKKEDFYQCYNWIDRWSKCVQGGNIKSWFSHNKKTYSHIPGTL